MGDNSPQIWKVFVTTKWMWSKRRKTSY